MTPQRRDLIKYSLAAAASFALPFASAQPSLSSVDPRDRVFITNEDSNTIVVINPRTNTVESTINLTSSLSDLKPQDLLVSYQKHSEVLKSKPTR
jgi:YVTN family beta-propeller protein